MPIYEFFCPDCNTVFNFYSPKVNTDKIPTCPKCQKRNLERFLSQFATFSSRKTEGDSKDFPLDESKMFRAIQMMGDDMENANDNDPKQMVSLLRKFNKALGVKMNDKVEEALVRMETGESPEEVASEIEEEITSENLFEEKKKPGKQLKKIKHNGNLYEL